MKRGLLLVCILSTVFFGRSAKSQDASGAPDNFIVVIGAFAEKGHADKFSAGAKKNKLSPMVDLNKIRNLYYVYVMETGDRSEAIATTLKLQGGKYPGAWVYNGTLGDRIIEPVKVPEPAPVEPKVEEKAIVIETVQPAPPPEKTEEEKIKEAVASKTMALNKGDRATLDYIFFFKDAAILRPESKYQVDHLLQAMKDNPEEKIVIHGHTNGNDKGKIIRLKNTNDNFFSLSNSVEDSGSAVKLSEMRANVIRDYLIKNGINKNRMSIKAWGGKKPLYKVDDDRAEANVRVEIEVENEG